MIFFSPLNLFICSFSCDSKESNIQFRFFTLELFLPKLIDSLQVLRFHISWIYFVKLDQKKTKSFHNDTYKNEEKF